MTKDERKEDIRQSIVFCTAIVFIMLLTGLSVCVNTYIQAVYELEMQKTRYLRHPYYSV